MVFIGLFYALMGNGWLRIPKHKSSAYCSFLAINVLPHSLDVLACLCGGASACLHAATEGVSAAGRGGESETDSSALERGAC